MAECRNCGGTVGLSIESYPGQGQGLYCRDCRDAAQRSAVSAIAMAFAARRRRMGVEKVNVTENED